MEQPPPPPPPPPPPHGAHGQGGEAGSGGLPPGKYDIFVIPPSSSGSGFLYLPSLQTHRNSFLAGCACTAAAFFVYNVVVPVIKNWFYNTLHGGDSGIFLIVIVVAVAAWAFGKTQGESSPGTSQKGGTRDSPPSGSQSHTSPPPQPHTQPHTQSQTPPPKSSWQRPQANTKASTDGKSAWEKAREETRKREEERKKQEELKKRREEIEKEKQRQREKDAQERADRERKEKEKAEADAKAKAAAERKAEEERKKAGSSPKRPPMPTAHTARGEDDDDGYSFRPYDRPRRSHKANSAASMYSESSYAASATTAKTTPPPSMKGPYSTKDPDKIVIKAVYSFNNAFMRTPISQLVSAQGNVTDGLILRITTEGLFIDDDIRGVPQREWDIKAWTMKLAETIDIGSLHVLRASIRDQEGKKYVFILSQSEAWKVAIGLQRLRRGTQVRALGVSGMPMNEAKVLIEGLGWS